MTRIFFQAEDGIRDSSTSRGLGDVYKRQVNEQEIFDFLTLLSAKGEASGEIAGGVFVLRNKSKRVNVENCVDTCGTGAVSYTHLTLPTKA